MRQLPEDTNQLKTIIAELEERVKELELIFESSYDEIFVTDGKGVTIRVNSACERYYDVSARDLVGKSVSELQQVGVFNESVTEKVIETKKRVTMFQKTKTGRRLLVTANPVINANGELIRIVCTSKDLTEVTQLKRQLAKMEGLVEQYNHELTELKAKRDESFVFQSKKMQRIITMAERVALTDATVLVLGESGVGKTALASLIHEKSHRGDMPFKTINCGAIPEQLMESELFGYSEGAFTGAKKGGHKGIFERANGGTILLDEIGELPLQLQVKLLHVLQEKRIQRVGGNDMIPVDVRIIAATNKNLEQMVTENRFREDLFYRLNVIPIDIPPLRDRKEDLIPLIEATLSKMNRRHHTACRLTPDTIERLLEYRWPGNIRELENAIERLVVTADSDEISSDQLPERYHVIPTASSQSETLPLKDWLELKEKELFLSLYKRYPSSYQLAEILQISQSTANRKLQRHLSQK